jgi:hypothetical protein
LTISACNNPDNLIVTVRLLIDKGADPKVKNYNNKSALDGGK